MVRVQKDFVPVRVVDVLYVRIENCTLDHHLVLPNLRAALISNCCLRDDFSFDDLAAVDPYNFPI
jgi:hypothetical protein